jgi:hypothetical protein
MIEHVELVGNSIRLPVASALGVKKMFRDVRPHQRTNRRTARDSNGSHESSNSQSRVFSNFGRCINAAASSFNVTLFDRLLMMTDTKNVPVIE